MFKKIHPDIERLGEQLNKKLGEDDNPNSDEEYIWRCYLDNKYDKNWKENFTFWLDIQSGKFAKTIAKKITNLLKVSEIIISRTENRVSQED